MNNVNGFNVVSSFTLPNFVLGAADPEMNRIEQVLTALAIPFSYALFQGVDGSWGRVHGGVAYKATEVGSIGGDGAITLHGVQAESLVMVECAVAGLQPMERLDHHNPGDRGYGARPELYWEASSLGQLFGFLKAWGAQRPTLGWEAGKLAAVFGEDRLLLAASDHCPSHAFQGKCPGVDVAALRAMRRENAAAFQKKDLGVFNAEVDAAVQALMDCPVARLGELEYRIAFDPIPQLNHAQLEAGVPVQYTMPGNARDPRTKVGLLGGSPELIRAWMDEKSITMDGVYGDPERGYAGCYVPAR